MEHRPAALPLQHGLSLTPHARGVLRPLRGVALLDGSGSTHVLRAPPARPPTARSASLAMSGGAIARSGGGGARARGDWRLLLLLLALLLLLLLSLLLALPLRPLLLLLLQGSGFRVQGLGFRVQGSGCRVQGAGFRVQGSGCRVQGSGSAQKRTTPRISTGVWDTEVHRSYETAPP